MMRLLCYKCEQLYSAIQLLKWIIVKVDNCCKTGQLSTWTCVRWTRNVPEPQHGMSMDHRSWRSAKSENGLTGETLWYDRLKSDWHAVRVITGELHGMKQIPDRRNARQDKPLISLKVTNLDSRTWANRDYMKTSLLHCRYFSNGHQFTCRARISSDDLSTGRERPASTGVEFPSSQIHLEYIAVDPDHC
jgi:hypothetical protein